MNAVDIFEDLEARTRTLLPAEYQDRCDEVRPVSMGSADLKFGPDGRVAWDEMWGSFCDLALAGGPPHKGTLLQPGSLAEIAARRLDYQQVVTEICRGIELVTGLPTEESPQPGWVRVTCHNHEMAAWLVRAITPENVSVRSWEGATLDLPAGPAYRLEKEIKNVITVIAKTCHYWVGHMPQSQRLPIAELFASMEVESPLLQPGSGQGDEEQALCAAMEKRLHALTGLRCSEFCSLGWLGVEMQDVRAGVWMMRALVASNVLARRENTTLFVPVNGVSDPEGDACVRRVAQAYALAHDRL